MSKKCQCETSPRSSPASFAKATATKKGEVKSNERLDPSLRASAPMPGAPFRVTNVLKIIL